MKEESDYGFCFKKAKGLKLIQPNNNLVEVYKRKSKSALNMLQSALEKQESDWILDTSYYAKYFMIYALFMKVGIKSEIHDCTIYALNSIFKDIVGADICENLESSRDLRVGSLYYDKDFGKDEILKKANTAPNFCLKVEFIIDNFTSADIIKIRKRFETIRKDMI